jgi:hypothetical protein
VGGVRREPLGAAGMSRLALIYATEAEARRAASALDRIAHPDGTVAVTLVRGGEVRGVVERPARAPVALVERTREGWAVLPLPDRLATTIEAKAATLPQREVAVEGERVRVALMSERVVVEPDASGPKDLDPREPVGGGRG